VGTTPGSSAGDREAEVSVPDTLPEDVLCLQEALRAYMQFELGVGALMLRLAEEADPAALVLLELIRDLQARTGELYVEETS
jgi:hypothetical protein